MKDEKSPFQVIKSNLPFVTKEEQQVIMGLLKIKGVREDTNTPLPGNDRRATNPTFTESESLLLDTLKQVSNVNIYNLPARDKKSLALATEVLDKIWEELPFPENIRRTRAAKMALYSEVVKLAKRYLLEVKVPLSARSIMNISGKYAGLLDRSYPGYITAGLLVPVVLLRGKISDL